MNKLKLRLDRLEVESFETAALRAEPRGTVAAHMPKPGGTTIQDTEITGPCCDYTLALSCVQTNCLECNVITADTCV